MHIIIIAQFMQKLTFILKMNDYIEIIIKKKKTYE
jgi:hypothetical protein